MITSIRTYRAISIFGLAVYVGGCTVFGDQRPRPATESERTSAPEKMTVIPGLTDKSDSVLPAAFSPNMTTLNEAMLAPDAIALVDLKSVTVTPESEINLVKLASQLMLDERLLVRLESFVPGGRSTALDIGFAENTLKVVRARLQSMGITSRRILSSSFGGEHSTKRASIPWVELYVVRPGFAASGAK